MKQNFNNLKRVRIYYSQDKQKVIDNIISIDKVDGLAVFEDKNGKQYLVNMNMVNMIEMESQ